MQHDFINDTEQRIWHKILLRKSKVEIIADGLPFMEVEKFFKDWKNIIDKATEIVGKPELVEENIIHTNPNVNNSGPQKYIDYTLEEHAQMVQKWYTEAVLKKEEYFRFFDVSPPKRVRILHEMRSSEEAWRNAKEQYTETVENTIRYLKIENIELNRFTHLLQEETVVNYVTNRFNNYVEESKPDKETEPKFHSSCTIGKSVDMEKITVEIQAMEDAYAAGEKAKDADAVAAYYSDDAKSYGRNIQPLSGQTAIRENIANDTTGNYNVYKIVDLFVEGNTAVEIGSWTEFDSSGNELENGNYMSYFQKRDGEYICVRDMTTTTSPVKSGI